MKVYDKVKVKNNNEQYLKKGIKVGDIGRITEAVIVDDCFTVAFNTSSDEEPYVFL